MIVDNKFARSCNAGNCIDEACGKSIGFPDDVVPYTTLVHEDLQSYNSSITEESILKDLMNEESYFN